MDMPADDNTALVWTAGTDARAFIQWGRPDRGCREVPSSHSMCCGSAAASRRPLFLCAGPHKEPFALGSMPLRRYAGRAAGWLMFMVVLKSRGMGVTIKSCISGIPYFPESPVKCPQTCERKPFPASEIVCKI